MLFAQGDTVCAKVDFFRYPWRGKSQRGDILYRAGDVLTILRVHTYAAGWHYWLTGNNGEVGADEHELAAVEANHADTADA